MSQKDDFDIWRAIPPEEKLEALARAQGKGVQSVLGLLLVGGTVAVALQFPWLFWGSLLLAPFIYQFTSGKEWRGLRPRMMLEYLAARSAARRYAFANRARNLGVQLIFRGHMTRVYGEDSEMERLEDSVENATEAAVWIALFNDTLVMMSEKSGGAKLEFAHPVNEQLTTQVLSPSGSTSPYQSNAEVLLSYADKRLPNITNRIKVSSKYPAALAVFERKLQASIDHVRQEKAALGLVPVEEFVEELLPPVD